MARVEWTRLNGEDVEAVVSMLLCLEYPDATRVRGDEGIDVLVPLPSGGVAVYQVKRHAENLSASQRAKPAKSHERTRTSEYAKTLDIREWHPTMPLDPTTTDLAWMTDLTKDEAWKPSWKGLAFIEALTAKWPMVVDYYLRDGKARADDATSRVTDLLKHHLGATGEGPLTAKDGVATLHSLFGVLADSDPYYVYGLSVDPTRPRLDVDSLPERTVMAVQYELPGESWATIKVIARANESLRERPISLSLVFDPGDNDQLREKFLDFMKYGTPFEAPTGSVSGNANAPGGLGGRFTDGAFSFTAVGDLGANPNLRLQVLDPEDTAIATCMIHRVERTAGPSGEGLRVLFDSDGKVFTWEVRFDLPAGITTTTARRQAVEAKTPADVLPALRVLHHLRPPNRVRIALAHGPASAGHVHTCPPPHADAELTDLVALVEALAEIQEHTTTLLTIPDPSTVTSRQLGDLQRVVALLRGETLRRPWTKPATVSDVGTAPEVADGEPFNARAHSRLVTRVGEQTIDLGWARIYYVAGRPAPGGPRYEGDSWELVLEPTEHSYVVLQRVASPDAPGPMEVPQPTV